MYLLRAGIAHFWISRYWVLYHKKGIVNIYVYFLFVGSTGSLDWCFTMPSAINGIRGSCVVIPCSYKFKTSDRSGVDVKWYSKTLTTSDLIYSQSSHNIIPKFKGKTSLYGSSNEKNCSLKIQPLDMSHNRERLFPWMDQNPPDTYHRKNVAEETIALEVTGKFYAFTRFRNISI